jgi:2'-5' RNA ligase
MRLFVALNLPERERRAIRVATECLRASDLPIRWAPEESLHLTLKFLGEVPPEALEVVETAVSAAAARSEAFAIEVGGVGAFPALKRPRVVWMAASGGEGLLSLHSATTQHLAARGFEVETRPFHPHVTLGRVKKHARPGDTDTLAGLAETVTYAERVGIDTVDVMRSHLTASGARYEVLSRCPLGERGSRPPNPEANLKGGTEWQW